MLSARALMVNELYLSVIVRPTIRNIERTPFPIVCKCSGSEI